MIIAPNVGYVFLYRVQRGTINLYTSTVGKVSAQQLSITRLSLMGVRSSRSRFEFRGSSDQLSLLSGTSQKVVFYYVKSDYLFFEPNSAKSITINDYVDTVMFFLQC